MMTIYNILYNTQSNTRTRLIILCLEERFENSLTIFLTDANAIVCHLYTEMFAIGFNLTGKADFIFAIFIGIG